MAKLKVTLIRGIMGCKPNQKATVKALGLTKRNSSVIVEDNPMMKGMINVVAHLVKVEEISK